MHQSHAVICIKKTVSFIPNVWLILALSFMMLTGASASIVLCHMCPNVSCGHPRRTELPAPRPPLPGLPLASFPWLFRRTLQPLIAWVALVSGSVSVEIYRAVLFPISSMIDVPRKAFPS